MTVRQKTIDRRCFIKATGLIVGLPFLESLTGGLLNSTPLIAAEPAPKSAGANLVCIGNLLGFHAPYFFPKAPGKDYDFPFLLEPLKPLKQDISLHGGLDHGLKGGHFAVNTFLTGVMPADAKGKPDGNISLDQRAAEAVGGTSRYPALTIGSEDGIHGGTMMSWTRSGSRVPPITTAKELFTKLFVDDNAADQAAISERFRLKHSILDVVNGEAKAVGKQLSAQDARKLDEYFTSVREVERKLSQMEIWSKVPKPKSDLAMPAKATMVQELPLLYDLIILALQSGSTRVATLEVGGNYGTRDFDIAEDYHLLSHHGQLDDRIKKLTTVERRQMDDFAGFLTRMKATSGKDGKSLLDNTMVLFGSGMGNANNHTNTNLPIILAGGGFKHGAFTQHADQADKRKPLCNLFLTLLQRFGVAVERFGTSTGTLTGVA